MFTNVCLKKASKDDKSKEQKISELQNMIEKQKKMIEDLKAEAKKAKLSHFVTDKM